MHAIWQSLYIRLSLALVALFLLIGIALVALTRYSAERYYQEVTQRLNAPLAMYVAGEAPLIRDGVVDHDAMRALAHQAMVINPTVEVYLLDPLGRVLAHDLGEATALADRIALAPVRHFLGGGEYPLMGDDPRSPGRQKIFTAAEVNSDRGLEGYVYVVLGGRQYERLAATAGVSDVMRLSTLAVSACVLFGLGSALLIFARLSRRLRELTRRADDYFVASFDRAEDPPPRGDEVARLASAFEAMQRRIDEQLDQLRRADARRRELVAHISHDLRTPLATMQGYIETLSLKQGSLDATEQREYLKIAHRHGRRLRRLIDDLFELARLDAGLVTPQWDRFCLAELAADIVQEYRLAAERKGVTVELERQCRDCRVRGDLGLIERVITNLLDNALEHTQPPGRIRLVLGAEPDAVRLTVLDTGAGIPAADLERVFERGFSTAGDGPGEHAGLGLAIVQRVLALHQATIRVDSRPGEGTAFGFVLAAAPR